MSPSTIPAEILNAEPEARLAYFEKKRIKHEEWLKAERELLARIRSAGRDRIIFLYGASGSGKSTLCRSIVRQITDEHREEMMVDLGKIPAVYAELLCPTSFITWSDVYRALLHGGNEILVDLKRAAQSEVPGVEFPRSDKASAGILLQAYLSMIDHRDTELSVLDNGNFFSLIRSGKQDQILTPLIAMCANIPHVVAGTAPLLTLRNITGQVIRRSRPGPIHLRRYQLGNGDDEDIFAGILNELANALPVALRPNLNEHFELLFAGCIGCIGLLKDWLSDALNLAILEHAKTVTEEHLIATHMDSEELSQLEAEAKEGEMLLQKRENMRLFLKAKVSERKTQEGKKKDDHQPQSQELETKQPDMPKKKGRKGKPFKRNPKRDPVGVAAHMTEPA